MIGFAPCWEALAWPGASSEFYLFAHRRCFPAPRSRSWPRPYGAPGQAHKLNRSVWAHVSGSGHWAFAPFLGGLCKPGLLSKEPLLQTTAWAVRGECRRSCGTVRVAPGDVSAKGRFCCFGAEL